MASEKTNKKPAKKKGLFRRGAQKHKKHKAHQPAHVYVWEALILFFLCAAFGVLTVHVYFFFRSSTDITGGAEEPLGTQRGRAMDQETLRETLQFFRMREQHFERVQTTPPSIIDPSL